MGPEELQELLDLIDQARQRGASAENINARLAANENLPFSSVDEVQAAFEGAQQGAQEAEDTSTPGQLVRLALQGGAGEFMDEGAGLLAGLGAALIPGGRGFGEARAFERARSRTKTGRAQEQQGLGGTAARIGGSIAPGAIALRGLRALSGGAQAGKGIGNIIAGGRPTSPLRTIGRGAGRLGTVGGLESGLLAAGRETGGMGERASAAADAAKIGGPLSAVLGAAGAAAPAARRALTRPSESGRQLASALRESGELAGKPSVIRQSAEQAKRNIRQRGFKLFEEIGEVASPRVRSVLQDDDIAPVVKQLVPDVAEGKAPSFLELQRVQQKLQGLRQAAFRSGDSFEVNKFVDAEKKLLDAMGESIEGFPRVRRAWAQQMRRLDALEEGRKVANKNADDIGSALENLPDDRQVRAAFREGVASDLIAKLEGGEAGVRTFAKNAKNNTQLRKKLIAVLGDANKADNFLQRIENQRGVIRKADLVEELIKAAGFLGLGTSLFGTAAVGQLQ